MHVTPLPDGRQNCSTRTASQNLSVSSGGRSVYVCAHAPWTQRPACLWLQRSGIKGVWSGLLDSNGTVSMLFKILNLLPKQCMLKWCLSITLNVPFYTVIPCSEGKARSWMGLKKKKGTQESQTFYKLWGSGQIHKSLLSSVSVTNNTHRRDSVSSVGSGLADVANLDKTM